MAIQSTYKSIYIISFNYSTVSSKLFQMNHYNYVLV